MPKANRPPMQEVHSNTYGHTTHDQGAIFTEWNQAAIALGAVKSNATLDCDRLIARRLGIRVKDYWRQTGKIK